MLIVDNYYKNKPEYIYIYATIYLIKEPCSIVVLSMFWQPQLHILTM